MKRRRTLFVVLGIIAGALAIYIGLGRELQGRTRCMHRLRQVDQLIKDGGSINPELKKCPVTGQDYEFLIQSVEPGKLPDPRNALIFERPHPGHGLRGVIVYQDSRLEWLRETAFNEAISASKLRGIDSPRGKSDESTP